jgi:NAD-dependent dihydropyrimidine dehydrogenase PreA subunit
MESPGMWDLLKEHWHLALHLRSMRIVFDAERCVGVYECYEVCPVDCWKPDQASGVVIFQNAEACIACGACVLQCPEDAIELR